MARATPRRLAPLGEPIADERLGQRLCRGERRGVPREAQPSPCSRPACARSAISVRAGSGSRSSAESNSASNLASPSSSGSARARPRADAARRRAWPRAPRPAPARSVQPKPSSASTSSRPGSTLDSSPGPLAASASVSRAACSSRASSARAEFEVDCHVHRTRSGAPPHARRCGTRRSSPRAPAERVRRGPSSSSTRSASSGARIDRPATPGCPAADAPAAPCSRATAACSMPNKCRTSGCARGADLRTRGRAALGHPQAVVRHAAARLRPKLIALDAHHVGPHEPRAERALPVLARRLLVPAQRQALRQRGANLGSVAPHPQHRHQVRRLRRAARGQRSHSLRWSARRGTRAAPPD